MDFETMFDQITSEIEKQEAEMCMGVHPDYFDTRGLNYNNDDSPIYEEDFNGDEDPNYVEIDEDLENEFFEEDDNWDEEEVDDPFEML